MPTLRKLMPLLWFVCIASLAQSSPPAQTSDSQAQTAVRQTAQPQPAPDADQKPLPDQVSTALPPDSTKLKPIKTQKTTYPEEAREKQLQGQVMVKVSVSATGDVANVEVISGDPVLARAAVEAAKKWKFEPFIKNGKPVPVFTKIPFDFAFSNNVVDTKPEPTTDQSSASGGPPKPIRVSQGVSTGLLIHKVSPIYPSAARSAHVQGTVVLQAAISKEGRVTNLRVISGSDELSPAAIGAVQQWRYRPYLLKGEPVEVETTIQVNFVLSGG